MLVLAFLLLVVPVQPDSTTQLERCERKGSVDVESPITWGRDVQDMWTRNPTVPADSIRSHLSTVRAVRQCYRRVDTAGTERPYLDEILRTYYVETALLAGLRRFSEALAAFDAAYEYPEKHPDVPTTPQDRAHWLSTLHQNHGFLHYVLGNLSASIEQYLKAYRVTPATETGRRVQFLIDVGILHQRTQDYSSARYYYERARALVSSESGTAQQNDTPRPRLLAVRADLILEETLNSDFDRGALKQARVLLEEARALAPSNSEQAAQTAVTLSESLGYLGAFDEAYRLNADVREYARRHDDARLGTFALLKLGVLHMQTEQWEKAGAALHSALNRARYLGDLDYQRRILRGLGRLHEMKKEWAAAERYYRMGTDVITEYRESLTASQWSMTAFAQWRDVNRGLVRSLLAQNRDREALAALDRSRARHLQDLRTRAHVANQLPPAQRTRLDSLSRALTDVRNRLGNGSLPSGEEASLRDRETRLMAARQQLLNLDSTASAPSIDAISKDLASQDRVLVSYFLDDPWAVYDRTPRSAAFVLTGDTLQTVPLPGVTQDSVQATVETISPLFTSRGTPDRSNAMHFDLRPLHHLHEALYAPVRQVLPSDRPMTVVPDGPLFRLPFSMLVDSMPGGRFSPSEARYVLHERPTSLELAASLIANTSRNTHDWSEFEPQMAAYGVSEFDTLATLPAALRTAAPEALTGSTLGLPPLPGVEKELKSLQSRFPDARVSLNDAATEANFCRSVRTAGVLHVATHAFVNPSSPLQNAILLRSGRVPPYGPASQEDDRPSGSAPDSTGATGSDGVLFLHELQGQRSRIPMVVLSGCGTARGTLRGGEGMEGLQYAFRAMGARSTVSTLWPVADDASVELMDTFYAYLEEGYAKDEALRQARLHILRTRSDWASPFFWAPPVLYGSPTPLPLDGRLLPVWAWWVLGIGGALLVLGTLIWWNQSRRTRPE